MIYEYEAQVLKFVNSIIPEIKESTYTKQDDMFVAMAPVMRYPAFMYSRIPTEYNWSKSIDLHDEGKFIRLFPVEQKYVGRIFVESNNYAFDIANRLRFGWNEKCKVPVNIEGESIGINLWLLYIKIDEERASIDKKGAKRFVEFSWKSNLFLTKDYSERYLLVDEVNYKIASKGVEVISGNEIIQVI